MRFLRIFIMGGLVVLTSGCCSTSDSCYRKPLHAYSGPKREKAELATLRFQNDGEGGMSLIKADDTFYSNKCSIIDGVFLLPGRHTLVVEFTGSSGGFTTAPIGSTEASRGGFTAAPIGDPFKYERRTYYSLGKEEFTVDVEAGRVYRCRFDFQRKPVITDMTGKLRVP